MTAIVPSNDPRWEDLDSEQKPHESQQQWACRMVPKIMQKMECLLDVSLGDRDAPSKLRMESRKDYYMFLKDMLNCMQELCRNDLPPNSARISFIEGPDVC